MARLGRMGATVLAVSLLTFLGTSLLPGDPARLILGENSTDQEAYDELRNELGLDEPLPVRYVEWLGNVATGDLGRSYRTGESVGSLLSDALIPTVQLLIMAELFALAVAVPLAVATAGRVNGPLDRLVTGATFSLLAIPAFAVAVLLIYLFAVTLGWLPATGYRSFSEDPVENLRRMVLPTLAIGIGLATVYLRVLRAELVGTLQEPFIRVARAKGLPRRTVLWRHGLRASLPSLVTVIGINIGTLIGGAVIVESLFGISGMGSLLVNAVSTREYQVVQGVVLVVAIGYVVVNTAVDAVYAAIDPRVALR